MNNIGNKIFDNDSKIHESKSKLNELQKITNNIDKKKNKIEKNIHENIFKYNTKDILDLMNLSDLIKDNLVTNVSNIHIYTIRKILNDVFVIVFLLHDIEYEFNIIIDGNRFNRVVTIYENGILKKEYDIKLEFVALDFEKINTDKFLENYIDLIVKNNKDYKLGMIIIAYYYFIEYKQYKNLKINKYDVLPKYNIKRLTEIFRYDMSSYIFDNYSDDTYEKI